MREIKFRAWDSEKEKMLEWDDLKLNDNDIFLILEDHYCGLTPMQYTGLKDKNGREIYEGDVVIDDTFIRDVVIFDDGAYWLRDIGQSFGDALLVEHASRIEVIGNIHEYPHLLEQS